ncbi:MAG: retropepsin-like domain-containing protein [Candidatus Sumerlaeia bacterium]|nr:retropepsin-like domain-containing protein [Candidatus Sumerlaeia bacterium]
MTKITRTCFGYLLVVLFILPFATGCGGRTQSHPLTYWNGTPWAKASVNGVIGTFLIDTGANMTVLDSEFAQRAGVRSDGRERVRSTTGEVILATGWANNIQFLGRDHERRYVSIQDLSTFRAPGGIRQSGLIGTDLLHGYTLVFQMEEASAYLHEGPGPAREGLAGFQFEMIDGIPTVQIGFGRGNDIFRTKGSIDTGSAYADESLLHLDTTPAIARKILGTRFDLPPDDMTMVRSISGVRSISLYDHGPVRLLGREFEVARIAVHDHGEGFFEKDVVLISGNILGMYPHIEFDFPRRRVWVDAPRPLLP